MEPERCKAARPCAACARGDEDRCRDVLELAERSAEVERLAAERLRKPPSGVVRLPARPTIAARAKALAALLGPSPVQQQERPA